MELIETNPRERLPNLSDREHPVCGYRDLMVNLPRYQCPHCDEFTVFEVGIALPSPLTPEIIAKFDAVTPLRRADEFSFSDFFCRVCSRPVRVTYRMVEAHMGSYQYFAESVVETK